MSTVTSTPSPETTVNRPVGSLYNRIQNVIDYACLGYLLSVMLFGDFESAAIYRAVGAGVVVGLAIRFKLI